MRERYYAQRRHIIHSVRLVFLLNLPLGLTPSGPARHPAVSTAHSVVLPLSVDMALCLSSHLSAPCIDTQRTGFEPFLAIFL